MTQRLPPDPARMHTERKIAIVGSGFIWLARALLAHGAGHAVSVFERNGRPPGASVGYCLGAVLVGDLPAGSGLAKRTDNQWLKPDA